MAGTTLKNQKVFYGGNDLTGHVNAVAFAASANAVEDTVIGQDSRSYQAGLKSFDFSLEALFDAPLEATILGAQGVNLPLSFTSKTSQPGDPAYIMQAEMGNIKKSASVGELLQYSVEAIARDIAIRGQLSHNGYATADGNAAGINITEGVPAAKKLVVAIHVFDMSAGDSIQFVIKSANTSGFSGGGTTQATSVVFTDKGSAFIEVDGPIAHTWFRPTWVVTGTDPNIGFAVFIGIK